MAAITSIEIAQRAIADPSGVGLAQVAGALQDIIQRELWRRSSHSFGEFAINEAPQGLGVRCMPAARLVRHALFDRGLFGPWAELLELIARNRARASLHQNPNLSQSA